MILVNISAVGTSITFTLQPVSCSHFGPEKFLGSSDCKPASQTMVMVLPLHIGFAASTARCAALCAPAVPQKASAAIARVGAIARLKRASGRGTDGDCAMLTPPSANFCWFMWMFLVASRKPGPHRQPVDYLEERSTVSSKPRWTQANWGQAVFAAPPRRGLAPVQWQTHRDPRERGRRGLSVSTLGTRNL